MKREITQEQVDAVTAILYDMYATASDVDFRSDYSGRGMYGKTCVGFVVQTPAVGLMSVGAALAEVLRSADEDDVDYNEKLNLLHFMVTNACIDNMGMDMIVYFPGVTLKNEDEN